MNIGSDILGGNLSSAMGTEMLLTHDLGPDKFLPSGCAEMVGKRSPGLLGLKPNASKAKLSLATMGLFGRLFLL
jgi:hypothetical protein